MKDFFVSYNSRDKEWAEWIAFSLESLGYTTIIQSWDFDAGGDFVLEMQKATLESDKTIAVLSSHYLEAEYTQAEWSAAFARDPTGKDRSLVPIRVGECKPSGLLKTRIYIDLVGLSEEQALSTLETLISGSRKKPATIEFPSSYVSTENNSTSELPYRTAYPGSSESSEFPNKALSLWQEKLEYLHEQEPLVSMNDRFTLIKLIEEAEENIKKYVSPLENEIEEGGADGEKDVLKNAVTDVQKPARKKLHNEQKHTLVSISNHDRLVKIIPFFAKIIFFIILCAVILFLVFSLTRPEQSSTHPVSYSDSKEMNDQLSVLTDGIDAFDSGDFEAARQFFESNIDSTGVSPDAYYWLAKVSAKHRQWGNGIDYINQALKNKTVFPAASRFRIKLLIMNAELDQSEIAQEIAKIGIESIPLQKWGSAIVADGGLHRFYNFLEEISDYGVRIPSRWLDK